MTCDNFFAYKNKKKIYSYDEMVFLQYFENIIIIINQFFQTKKAKEISKSSLNFRKSF
jgi:hypothetical protein